MRTAILDQSGKAVSLGRQIGRVGGEGVAFEAISHPGFVVKLYHAAPGEDKVQKLRHLVELARGKPDLLKFAAWPTSLVCSTRQEVCGFLMPTVVGKEIHELYGPRQREIEFPSANWDFLIHVARNCAAVFDSVHSTGVVIGDVNEGNLLVTNDGTVRLIDCDSWQVNSKGKVWTCDVGVAFWTPPELQGKRFRGLVRSANHDLFGLAVLVFKLLFMGRHPYAGSPIKGDLPLEKAIANYMFAFSANSPALGLLPPPHCLKLTDFAPDYIRLFESAFMRGSEKSRPIASMWANALDAMLKEVVKCTRDPSHKYPRSFANCPWCSIAAEGGPRFFVSVTVLTGGESINVAELWTAISRLEKIPLKVRGADEIQLPPASGAPLPRGLRKYRIPFFLGCGMALIGIIILIFNPGLLGAAVLLIACGLFSHGIQTEAFKAECERRRRALEDADAEIARLFEQISAVPGQYSAEFLNIRQSLQDLYGRYKRLDTERMSGMMKLEEAKRKLQLREFLVRQIIRRADIPGIGASRVSKLLAYGVESAWDINRNTRVPGIGPTYLARLVAWREHCERQFTYNSNAPVPAHEIRQLDLKISATRNGLISELRQGPDALANLGMAAKSRIARLDAQINGAGVVLAQALADYHVVQE